MIDDWDRAFFTRVLACLGTVPLVLACGPLMILPNQAGGAKETLILVFSVSAALLLALALFLGRMRALESEQQRWKLGNAATVFIAFELILSGYLIVGNAVLVWSSMRP